MSSLPSDPLSIALANALMSPAEASTDNTSARSHSLPDMIMAMKYLSGVAAANSPTRGVRFNAIIPGGAVRARPLYVEYGGLWGYGFSKYRW